MWLITNFGFFSIVQKPEDKKLRCLTVRSRTKTDLESLREKYLPQMGQIEVNAGSDYKYRARVPRSDIAVAALQMLLDLDYANFKDSVAKEQGKERAHLYHKIWDTLFALQDKEAEVSPASVSSPPKVKSCTKDRCSYGGVMVDGQGRVLLRKPKSEYDNYVWTFAKGKPAPGDSPEEAALREVREETGYVAEIIGKIPGSFAGGTGTTEYFLMRPGGDPAPFDSAETEAVKWVPYQEAATYINQTRNEIRRQRDLAVLRAAVEYQQLKEKQTGDTWYFAYGSNLSIDQKQLRTGRIRQAIRCRLAVHRLAFNKRGKNDQVFANIIPDNESEVWGVIYLCNPAAIKEMDRYEGVSGGHYENKTVHVVTDAGNQVEALTYIAGAEHVGDEGKPSDEYFGRILSGARHHGLPEPYIDKLVNLGSAKSPRRGK